MARRLKTIAKWINENMDGYTATVEPSWSSTDRKIGRLRSPGKGRNGTRIVVMKNGEIVKRHDSSETYRTNQEMEDWIVMEVERWTPVK